MNKNTPLTQNYICPMGVDSVHDMRLVDGQTHWHGGHPTTHTKTVYENAMLPCFETIVEPLRERGVEVVNCTPGSALDVFQKLSLDQAL